MLSYSQGVGEEEREEIKKVNIEITQQEIQEIDINRKEGLDNRLAEEETKWLLWMNKQIDYSIRKEDGLF